MAEKMAESRAKGRSGWNDPEKCSVDYLRFLLYEHLDKGDPVDVANICMMLRHYDASTYRDNCNCKPAPDVAQIRADDGPESIASLAHHLRKMADGPVDAIDSDRLLRAAALIDTPPQPDTMAGKVAALVEAAESMIDEYLSWKPVGENHHFEPEEEVSALRLRAALAAMKGGDA